MSDPQLSVVAVVSAEVMPYGDGEIGSGRVLETMEYEPYGRVRRTLPADFNHDGAVTIGDLMDGFLPACFAGFPCR